MSLLPFVYRIAPEFFYSAAQSHIFNLVWFKKATLYGRLIFAASGSEMQTVAPMQRGFFVIWRKGALEMKVYLAGGFIHGQDLEDDPLNWRYSIVKGLTEKTPYTEREGHRPPNWAVMENAIAGCIDYVGPYAEHQFDEGFAHHFCKQAIRDADLVFAWVDDYLHPAEIGKVSTEIAFAYALEKPVGVGASDETSDAMISIWFANEFKDFSTFPYIKQTPYESFVEFVRDAIPFLPVETRVAFSKKNHQARMILGRRLRRPGYVYIIRAETGHYKIGRTKNVPNRMKLFEVKLPFNFEIVNYFLCDDAHLAEKELHQVLAKYNTNGEWFSLPQDIVDLLASIREYVVFDEEAEITYFCDKNSYTFDFNMQSLEENLNAYKKRTTKK